jgi:hypothetical protein
LPLSFYFSGTQEPFRYGGFLEQLLPPAKPLVPAHPSSIPAPSDSVPATTQSGHVPSNTESIPGQPVTVPALPQQHLPVHTQPISSSLSPLHMPTDTDAALEKSLKVNAHPTPVPSLSVSGKSAPKPRVAWVCCDECGKWRCIPAELADVIDETNCRWYTF